jgi:hypothetical protein
MKPGGKALKPESVNDLQELVADHIETIEPGLRLLGSRVALGGATIDLLTVDSDATPTLIALGFTGDDQMLLRALEAYSWCLEYPDALGRLYPAERLSTAAPRVFFIAERLNDAFLRKIRHLRFSRVNCLEFYFGLQFKLVEELSGTDDAPERRGTQVAEPPRAAVAPAPIPSAPPRPEVAAARRPVPPEAPRTEPVAPRSEPPRVEPRRREEAPLAPRSVAPKPAEPEPVPAGTSQPLGESRESRRGAGEVDEGMVLAVREYLLREFPTAVVYDFFAHDRNVQMFHLQDSQGALIHSAAVTGELLERGTESQLRAFLDKHRLARVLRQAGAAGVSVSKAGLRIERR